jgi:hypothetical protein
MQSEPFTRRRWNAAVADLPTYKALATLYDLKIMTHQSWRVGAETAHELVNAGYGNWNLAHSVVTDR